MRQPSPQLNRRASTALLLVATLTLSLSPTGVAAAAPADGGNAEGWYQLRVADEGGQCDPDTGLLTGSSRHNSDHDDFGYPDGDQDYLVGGYGFVGLMQGLTEFRFCMEIDPVKNAAVYEWWQGEGSEWWEGEGSGVIFSLAGQPMYRMPSLRLLAQHKPPLGNPGNEWIVWGLLRWRIAGRYTDTAETDVGGIFDFAETCPDNPTGSCGVWNMVRDTY